MPFITRDHARLKDLDFWQSVKATVAFYYYKKIMNPLANAGFFTTEPGCVLRWREFTPFFWRTLVNRAKVRLEARIKELETMLAFEQMEVRSAQVNTSIIVGGIVKAAGGEVTVNVGDLLIKDVIETSRDPVKDTITYKIVEQKI